MWFDPGTRKINMRKRQYCWAMMASGNTCHLFTKKMSDVMNMGNESHSGKEERTFAGSLFFRNFHSIKKLGNNNFLFSREIFEFLKVPKIFHYA
jgi:hypothetical protein